MVGTKCGGQQSSRRVRRMRSGVQTNHQSAGLTALCCSDSLRNDTTHEVTVHKDGTVDTHACACASIQDAPQLSSALPPLRSLMIHVPHVIRPNAVVVNRLIQRLCGLAHDSSSLLLPLRFRAIVRHRCCGCLVRRFLVVHGSGKSSSHSCCLFWVW